MKNSSYKSPIALAGLLALLLLFITFSACEKDDPVDVQQDFSAIITNIGNDVILNTYEGLADKAALLQAATEALEATPSMATLEAARQAWAAARAPWEQSEGFLFGPVDQEGLDPSIDSWPVNVTDLNNVLSSSNSLTVEFLKAQEGTLKGFHTIEFLLWGENGDKQVGAFTAREFEYMAACAGALAADAAELSHLWDPTGGNFIENVVKAGEGSPVYVSQKAALEEITSALIIIADEVGNGKINDPFSQEDLTLEESRFSANSKADFSNNIRSIRNVYTGYYGGNGDGNGISVIINEKDAALDTQVLAEIDAAILAIESIPGTFSDAVFNAKTDVSAAQQAVRALQETLESKVLPLISGL
ncbi:MAG: imelysin [Lewinellaceae bacterium]|nr:imelysin [Lewinellaceae bacterium]